MPQTLLLADDSTTIQRVIELTFAGEDIQVVAVSDGDQAIARIQSAPPDIVLADVGMPGKTGYEVAEYIKQTPQLAHIPVVLLTGAFEPVDQAKATAVGCDGVLAKPFEPQIVIGRVRELLGKGTAAPAAPASAFADGKAPAAADKASNVVPFSAEPPASSPEPQGNAEPRVEDYFDRIDAAFASFSGPSTVVPDMQLAPPPAPAVDEPPPIRVAKFEPEPEPEPAPTYAAAEAEPIRLAPAPEPTRVEQPEPEPEPVAALPPEPASARQASNPEPHGPRELPSIADAFSAILAAEQNALGVKPEWPAPSSQAPAAAASAAPAELVITDDLVDRVARRVLEQLSDKVVRETVTDIASQTAERLVREEIERIKSAIK